MKTQKLKGYAYQWLAVPKHADTLWRDAAMETGEILATELRRRIRRLQHPDAERLAEHVKVYVEKGEVHVGIQQPDLAQTMFDIEHGDEGHAPIPIMRSTMNDMKDRLSNHMQEALARRLPHVPIR